MVIATREGVGSRADTAVAGAIAPAPCAMHANRPCHASLRPFRQRCVGCIVLTAAGAGAIVAGGEALALELCW